MQEYFEKQRIEYWSNPENLAKMKYEKKINGMAARIQRRWRDRKACRLTMLEVEELKRQKQEAWKIKKKDEKVIESLDVVKQANVVVQRKKNILYMAKDALGQAATLQSDTAVDVAIKKLNFVARAKVRTGINAFFRLTFL